jgi:hypothetical protein
MATRPEPTYPWFLVRCSRGPSLGLRAFLATYGIVTVIGGALGTALIAIRKASDGDDEGHRDRA